MTVAQLTLDLPHRAALGAEDFLVSDCNMAAVKLIDSWPAWQDNLQLLIGPAASGKTHLARVWQALSGACSLNPDNLGIDFVDAMGPGTPLVVEDADRVDYDEQALFHLLNLAREKRLSVLLTARGAPRRWRSSAWPARGFSWKRERLCSAPSRPRRRRRPSTPSISSCSSASTARWTQTRSGGENG